MVELTGIPRVAGMGRSGGLAQLLDHGGDASIDAEDKARNTPLHHAASAGILEPLRFI
jgi:hypothetical protein